MIRSIFISHHFDANGKKMAGFIKSLLQSHNIQYITGERLGGRPLDDEVRRLIDKCQATIVLLTKREQGQDDQWVKDERTYAIAKKQRTITLIENGLTDSGMHTNNERLKINWEALHLVLLELSYTIGEWKNETGTDLKLLIQPDSLSEEVLDDFNEILFEYQKRSSHDNDEPQWEKIKARPEIGGAIIKIPGYKKGELIDIVKTDVNGNKWEAKAINPVAAVKLIKKNQ